MLNHNYLQIALYKNKIPKSIYEVETGIACDCNCPICGSALEAKNKGKEWDKPLRKGQKIAHFAHSGGSNCKGAPESMLHKVAKSVLKEILELKAPSITREGIELCKAQNIKFDSCKSEVKVNIENTFIQIDSVLYKNKKELYIEFYKTHKVEDQKIEKIKKLNKNTIEIDLNNIPVLINGEVNKNGIKENLINEMSNRNWLYNNQIEERYEKYQNKISKHEKKVEVANKKVEIVENEFNKIESINFLKETIRREKQFKKYKTELLKKGYEFLKIYKKPKYDFDGGYRRFMYNAEIVYCPKLKKEKFPKNNMEIQDCDNRDWSIACGFGNL